MREREQDAREARGDLGVDDHGLGHGPAMHDPVADDGNVLHAGDGPLLRVREERHDFAEGGAGVLDALRRGVLVMGRARNQHTTLRRRASRQRTESTEIVERPRT